MSLAIEVEQVSDVLLADGRWYVVDGASFDVDSYEFVHDERTALEGAQDTLIASTGFTFRIGNERMSGPLTSILAIKVKVPRNAPNRVPR
jgi:hypothetical protein